MREHILDWNVEQTVGTGLPGPRNTRLSTHIGNRSLIKMQMSAFASYSTVRICGRCGREVHQLLHGLDCDRSEQAIVYLIREVEELTVRKGLAKDIWEVIRYP